MIEPVLRIAIHLSHVAVSAAKPRDDSCRFDVGKNHGVSPARDGRQVHGASEPVIDAAISLLIARTEETAVLHDADRPFNVGHVDKGQEILPGWRLAFWTTGLRTPA